MRGGLTLVAKNPLQFFGNSLKNEITFKNKGNLSNSIKVNGIRVFLNVTPKYTSNFKKLKWIFC
tara:strand:- start:23 stop:214 length:192 start_codon:yes stop_codon:yes gene_type:complete